MTPDDWNTVLEHVVTEQANEHNFVLLKLPPQGLDDPEKRYALLDVADELPPLIDITGAPYLTLKEAFTEIRERRGVERD